MAEPLPGGSSPSPTVAPALGTPGRSAAASPLARTSRVEPRGRAGGKEGVVCAGPHSSPPVFFFLLPFPPGGSCSAQGSTVSQPGLRTGPTLFPKGSGSGDPEAVLTSGVRGTAPRSGVGEPPLSPLCSWAPLREPSPYSTPCHQAGGGGPGGWGAHPRRRPALRDPLALPRGFQAGRPAVRTAAAEASWRSAASAAATWPSWRPTVPPPPSPRGTCRPLRPCFR